MSQGLAINPDMNLFCIGIASHTALWGPRHAGWSVAYTFSRLEQAAQWHHFTGLWWLTRKNPTSEHSSAPRACTSFTVSEDACPAICPAPCPLPCPSNRISAGFGCGVCMLSMRSSGGALIGIEGASTSSCPGKALLDSRSAEPAARLCVFPEPGRPAACSCSCVQADCSGPFANSGSRAARHSPILLQHSSHTSSVWTRQRLCTAGATFRSMHGTANATQARRGACSIL